MIKKQLNEIGILKRGIRQSKQDLESKEGQKVKIVNWPDFKKMSEGINLDSIPFTKINTLQKQKDDIYVKKGDIVIPTFVTMESKKAILVENDIEPNKYIYGASVYVFRVTDNSISKEYVCMILNSNTYVKNKFGSYTNILRYKELEQLEIPILNENTIKKLLDKKTNIERIKLELKKEQEQLNNELDNLLKNS